MKTFTTLRVPRMKYLWGLFFTFWMLSFTPLVAQISFLSQNVVNNLSSPTSLQFGPDGKLYVSQQNGTIKIYTISRNGAGNYQVTGTETINLINTGTPNHNDDGSSNGTQQRQVTGLLVLGTASNPILYVSSSDWRTAVGNDINLDTNSGTISKLTKSGGNWTKVDIVRGLPRSEENHSVNGMEYDASSNTLYIMVGGITNKGAPGNNFAGTPEYALSAALVSIDMNVINSMPVYTDARTGTKFVYDIPTLDDPTRANINKNNANFPYPSNHPLYNSSIDPGDPFGGNNGLNQARLVPGGPVQVYSPGYRNAYDIVKTTSGKLYTYDNGPNGGWGGLPKIYSSNGSPKGTGPANWQNGDYASNEFNDGSSDGHWDRLHHISGPGYYGGHPNPTRANPQKSKLYVYNKSGSNWNLQGTYDFFDDFPDPPVSTSNANPKEAAYIGTGSGDPSLTTHWASSNGICEYTASNFNNALKGDLLVANFNDAIMRVELNGSGTAVNNQTNMLSGGNNPLDVTTQGDNDIFPGTIWVAVHGGNQIKVFEPTDYDGGGGPTCTGNDDPNLDEDNDGYSNADEIDNNTDPCSQGSVPPDYDGDGISNLNDNDDDNDGLLDTYDPFAVDPHNGLSTNLNVQYGFSIDNGASIPGTLFGLGFTGVMTNGNFNNNTPGSNYQDLYSENNLNLGGAAAKLGIENIGPGTSEGNNNNQHNAFQFGVNVDNSTPPFTIHTEVESPYFLVNGNPITPANFQSMGLFMGTGDQDNYVKIVMNAQGGQGGIAVVYENGGTASKTNYNTGVVGNILSSQATDLYLDVDPGAATVQAKVSIDGGANIVTLGSPISVPASWFNGNDNFGLAIGVISTSFGTTTPFDATWDHINVTSSVAPGDILYRVNAGGPQVAAIDAPNPNWEADAANNTATQYHNSTSYTSNHTVNGRHASVPSEVPQAVFQHERWDHSSGDEMQWFFNLPNPGTYEVRLFFANGYSGTSQPGQRVFSVEIEGSSVLSNYDISADVGHATGVMKSFLVNVSDGTLNIDFFRTGADNPLVNAIEVLGTNSGPSPGNLAVNPNSVHFFSQNVGTTSAPESITLSNTGGESLNITGIALTGQHAAEFSHNATAPFTLGPGANTAIDVTFSPTSAGSKGASLSFTHDGANTSPLVVSLTGEAIAPNPVPTSTSIPDITVPYGSSDDVIDLNNYFEDDQGDANLTYTVQNNTGSQIGASINSNLLTISYPASQTDVADITIRATDQDGNYAEETFTVNVIDPTNTASILYRVNAGGPAVSALDAGNPDWEADPLKNTTTQYHNSSSYISNHTVNGRDGTVGSEVPQAVFQTERWDHSHGDEMKWFFSVPNSGTYEVRLYLANGYAGTSQPGQRVFNVEIEGNPVLSNLDLVAEVGHQVGTMKSFNVNITDGTINIDFYRISGKNDPIINAIEIIGGSGGPAPSGTLAVNPSSISFPDTDINTSSNPVTLTLNNTGNGLLSISNVTITGPDAAMFSHNAATSLNISAGSSQSFGVTFTPGSTGNKSAMLNIYHDGSNTSPVQIPLTGTGTNPPAQSGVLSVTPASVSFPDQQENTSSSPVNVNMTNTGNANLVVSSATITGPDAAMFSHNFSGATSISASASQTIQLSFSPTTTGDMNATLNLYHDGSNASPVQVPLSGKGISAPPTGGAVLYRVNAAGPAVPALDSPNPAWEADQTNGTTQYHNSSNYTSGHQVAGRHSSVPASAPQDLFQTERWDHSSGDEMKWFFNVAPGNYEVRLYFANGYWGTYQPGQRMFDVEIESNLVLNDLDIVSEVGHRVGMTKTFVVNVTDGTLNIDFYRITGKNDPIINAIEILSSSAPPERKGLSSTSDVGFIRVYPNPFEKQRLNIVVKKELGPQMEIYLYDMYGKLIYEQQAETKSLVRLDLSDVNMPAGVYFLRVGSPTAGYDLVKLQRN